MPILQEIDSDDASSVTSPYCAHYVNLLADDKWRDYLNYGVPLYQASLRGDWVAARQILHLYPACITARITKLGDTVLHVATVARHTYFVEELVKLMVSKGQSHDLALANGANNTALCLAAASGAVRLAEVMVEANESLHLLRGHEGLTPLHIAALLGHREMTLYLWKLIRHDDLSKEEIISLFISTINTCLYDVALKILQRYSYVATARDKNQETPLHVLARKSTNYNGSQLGIWRRIGNIFGSKCRSGYGEDGLNLVDRIWAEVKRRPQPDISDLLANPWRLLFAAVQVGNVEFLTILIRSYPDLVWKVDDNGRSLFHVAIIYRQEKIFRLIYELGTIKDLLAMYTDEKHNTMLHMASKLPSSNILNCISGAALQMQREIMWFKVIEDLMQPQLAEDKNEDDETPRELFTKEHQELRKKGEKWMTKTASSCSVVAALIASVVFGATWKVSGVSYVNNNGLSANSHSSWYWVFAISDGLSLISSTASIFMFLSILTSRYAEEDFRQSLPLKLMIGITLLFISIANMMIAFTAIFSIVFKHGLLCIGTSILSSIPIILFAIQTFPLLQDVYISTLGCNFIFRPQNLLFQSV